MSLKSLEIDSSYSTDGGNNLLYSFYNPVLEEATSYDRVTGFFLHVYLLLLREAFVSV